MGVAVTICKLQCGTYIYIRKILLLGVCTGFEFMCVTITFRKLQIRGVNITFPTVPASPHSKISLFCVSVRDSSPWVYNISQFAMREGCPNSKIFLIYVCVRDWSPCVCVCACDYNISKIANRGGHETIPHSNLRNVMVTTIGSNPVHTRIRESRIANCKMLQPHPWARIPYTHVKRGNFAMRELPLSLSQA
jgi:hypothetical protein